jgi:hypothetical protein
VDVFFYTVALQAYDIEKNASNLQDQMFIRIANNKEKVIQLD